VDLLLEEFAIPLEELNPFRKVQIDPGKHSDDPIRELAPRLADCRRYGLRRLRLGHEPHKPSWTIRNQKPHGVRRHGSSDAGGVRSSRTFLRRPWFWVFLFHLASANSKKENAGNQAG